MDTTEKIKNLNWFNLVNGLKEVLLELRATQGIEEAPMDGKEYVRKDGEWVEVAPAV